MLAARHSQLNYLTWYHHAIYFKKITKASHKHQKWKAKIYAKKNLNKFLDQTHTYSTTFRHFKPTKKVFSNNSAWPILDLFTACQVIFEKLNGATSKPFVWVCYTGQPTKNVSQSLKQVWANNFVNAVVSRTHQVKIETIFIRHFFKLEQRHRPQL